MKRLAFLMVAMLLLTGCGEESVIEQKNEDIPDVIGGEYTVETDDEDDVVLSDAPEDDERGTWVGKNDDYAYEVTFNGSTVTEKTTYKDEQTFESTFNYTTKTKDGVITIMIDEPSASAVTLDGDTMDYMGVKLKRD